MKYKNDFCIKGTAYGGNIRLIIARTSNLVEKSRKIFNLEPTSLAALGRFETLSILYGIIKDQKTTTSLSINGDNLIKKMTCEVNNKGHIRAYIDNPDVHDIYQDGPKKGKLSVGASIGNGTLNVKQELENGVFFDSSIELVSGEIGDDFTKFFYASEQIPTACGAGVLVDIDYTLKVSGGFILQILPQCSDELIEKIEENLSKVSSITTFLIDNKQDIDQLAKVLTDDTFILQEEFEPEYNCGCSKGYYLKGINKIDVDTLTNILNEDKKIEIKCGFCDQIYNYDELELTLIIKNKHKLNKEALKKKPRGQEKA